MNHFTISMMVHLWILSTVLRTLGLSNDLITYSIPQYKRRLTVDKMQLKMNRDLILIGKISYSQICPQIL